LKDLIIKFATSSQHDSKAKCPILTKYISIFGTFFLKAFDPAVINDGSFFPQTAKRGGLYSLKYF